MKDPISNEELREAILATGVSMSDIARNAGWMKPAPERVRKALGLQCYYEGKDRKTQRYLSYDNALTIARAAGLDPVDVGL